jgi:hypothetical protein
MRSHLSISWLAFAVEAFAELLLAAFGGLLLLLLFAGRQH